MQWTVGQRVTEHGGYEGSSASLKPRKLVTVTKVDRRAVTTSDGHKWSAKTGKWVGAVPPAYDVWHIAPTTPADEAAIARRTALRTLKGAKWGKLSDDALQQVVAILAAGNALAET